MALLSVKKVRTMAPVPSAPLFVFDEDKFLPSEAVSRGGVFLREGGRALHLRALSFRHRVEIDEGEVVAATRTLRSSDRASPAVLEVTEWFARLRRSKQVGWLVR